MKNRHAAPSIARPGKCPKCSGFITTGIAWTVDGMGETWRCVACGLTGESNSYLDTAKKRMVELSGPVAPYRGRE